MKVLFLSKNGLTLGLNLNVLLTRKTSRLLSSVNSALLHLSSSEDDIPLHLEDSNHVPTASKCGFNGRISEPYAARNHVANEVSLPGSQEESGDAEMEVLEMILEDNGLGFAHLKENEINFDEEYIIKAMNVLFFEGGSGSLPLLLFSWLECSFGVQHTIRTVCSLIHLLILGNMNHRVVDLLAYLICGYSRHIKPNELLKVLQDVCTERVLETVYSMVLRRYVAENMIDEAIEAICLMKEVGSPPSERNCNLLIKSLLESGYVKLAWDFLEKMQGQFMVNVETFTLFIHHYCREGNLDFGRKLLLHMDDFGMKADVVAYTTFIHHLCKLSYVKEATCLVFKMIDTGVTPDLVLLTSIFNALCKVGRVEDALCILKLFYVEPDVVLYNSIISKLCKENNMEQASIVFQELLDMRIIPDCYSYTSMIDGYFKTNNKMKALQYFGKMLKAGIEPSVVTYTVLISSYCKKGDMEIAQALRKKMTRKGLMPDIVVYNTLINGYTNQGQLMEAFELSDTMGSVGVLPDVVTHNTLIHGLIMGGYLLQANDLMSELVSRGFSPDKVTYTSLIGGYARKGLFEDSFSLWAYMNEKNILPDVITCTALLSGCCRASLMDEASALFNKMVGTGLVPDLIMYNTLIHGFCRIGDTEGACQMINMMIENNVCPNDVTYKALVHGNAKKHATNPMESAADKLQHILQAHAVDSKNDWLIYI